MGFCTMRNLSTGRSCLSAGAAFLTADRAGLAQSGALTAGQVIERIQQNVGVPWRENTVDTVKAGNADTPVKGIAVGGRRNGGMRQVAEDLHYRGPRRVHGGR